MPNLEGGPGASCSKYTGDRRAGTTQHMKGHLRQKELGDPATVTTLTYFHPSFLREDSQHLWSMDPVVYTTHAGTQQLLCPCY